MMDLINKNDVKTIGSIGAGPIGAGWVAYFLSQGLSVKAYLHNESEENNSQVVHYKMLGGGHWWDYSFDENLKTSYLLWDFFSRHSKD